MPLSESSVTLIGVGIAAVTAPMVTGLTWLINRGKDTQETKHVAVQASSTALESVLAALATVEAKVDALQTQVKRLEAENARLRAEIKVLTEKR